MTDSERRKLRRQRVVIINQLLRCCPPDRNWRAHVLTIVRLMADLEQVERELTERLQLGQSSHGRSPD